MAHTKIDSFSSSYKVDSDAHWEMKTDTACKSTNGGLQKETWFRSLSAAGKSTTSFSWRLGRIPLESMTLSLLGWLSCMAGWSEEALDNPGRSLPGWHRTPAEGSLETAAARHHGRLTDNWEIFYPSELCFCRGHLRPLLPIFRRISRKVKDGMSTLQNINKMGWSFTHCVHHQYPKTNSWGLLL